MKTINLATHPEILDAIFGHFNEYIVEPFVIGGQTIGRIKITAIFDFSSADIGKKVVLKLEEVNKEG